MSGAHKHHLITIILILLFLSPVPILTPAQPPLQTTQIDQLAHQQELILPIDTSNPHTRYQPIDIHVEFDPPAWAQNETHHAVRIAYDQAGTKNELESQLYELEYTDDNHITSCNPLLKSHSLCRHPVCPRTTRRQPKSTKHFKRFFQRLHQPVRLPFHKALRHHLQRPSYNARPRNLLPVLRHPPPYNGQRPHIHSHACCKTLLQNHLSTSHFFSLLYV